MSRSALVLRRRGEERPTPSRCSTRGQQLGDARLVRVEEAFRRNPVDYLGQLPSQIHRILHAGLEALSAIRRMDVRGIASDQDSSFAIGCSLTPRR